MHYFSIIDKITVQFILFLTLLMPGFAQSDFDKMLDTMYKKTVPLISPAELQQLLSNDQKIVVLDIRSEKEFVVSHIEGAELIDYDTFNKKKVKDFDKNAKVIVYCSVGYRSERIGEKLQKMGFSDVQNLYGGIFMWKNEDHKVVDPKGINTDYVHTFNKAWSKWLKNGIKVYE